MRWDGAFVPGETQSSRFTESKMIPTEDGTVTILLVLREGIVHTLLIS